MGDWLSALYEACLEECGDEELAELMALTVLEDRLIRGVPPGPTDDEHAAAA